MGGTYEGSGVVKELLDWDGKVYVCWYLRGGKMWLCMYWDAGGDDAGLGGGACLVVHSPGGVELSGVQACIKR